MKNFKEMKDKFRGLYWLSGSRSPRKRRIWKAQEDIFIQNGRRI